jgi:hypothetical protein
LWFAFFALLTPLETRSYRFMVSPGDFEDNITDADSIIEWESVEQVLYPTPIEYECVICLFPPTCAKIAKCGHVFCHGCMLRYFTYMQQGTQSMPCPICLKERIFLKDLKSVQFIHVPKYAVGDAARFDLLRRPKHVNSLTLCAPNPDVAAVDDSLMDDELPVWGDRHSTFNRLVVSYDLGEIQRREAKELEDAIHLADSSREDSLPFLLASQERLLARAKEIEPVVTVQRTLYAQRIAQHMTRRKLPPATEDDHYFFYQSTDGQHLFLHPTNVKWLVLEFGSHSKFPFQLEAKILDMEDMTQTEQTRKRYKYLGHLPISADFKFVLVDLDHVLMTPANKAGFKEDVKTRADQLREKRLEQDRRLRATARKPVDPYRVAMEHHFAPPSAAFEDQFDLDSPEAFPSVHGTAAAEPAPVEIPQEQPKPKGAWTTGASKLVKNAVDEYPALPGAVNGEQTGPKPVAPAPLPTWGKPVAVSPAATPTSSTQSKPQAQPTVGGASGKKKKKMVLLMSAPQQKS